MVIYECFIELHDNLFFATREMGRLYETGSLIHNYALSYALGASGINKSFPISEYFSEEQIPKYKEHLSSLDLYITPAKPINTNFVFNTFKFGEEDFYLKSTIGDSELKRRLGVDGGGNKPDYGRAKEISVGGLFHFFIFSKEKIDNLPKWIRLGKWMSKAEVSYNLVENYSIKKGKYLSACSINPLDLKDTKLINFDLVSMPPSSLLNNATLEGEYFEFEKTNKTKVCLPKNLKYRFE